MINEDTFLTAVARAIQAVSIALSLALVALLVTSVLL